MTRLARPPGARSAARSRSRASARPRSRTARGARPRAPRPPALRSAPAPQTLLRVTNADYGELPAHTLQVYELDFVIEPHRETSFRVERVAANKTWTEPDVQWSLWRLVRGGAGADDDDAAGGASRVLLATATGASLAHTCTEVASLELQWRARARGRERERGRDAARRACRYVRREIRSLTAGDRRALAGAARRARALGRGGPGEVRRAVRERSVPRGAPPRAELVLPLRLRLLHVAPRVPARARALAAGDRALDRDAVLGLPARLGELRRRRAARERALHRRVLRPRARGRQQPLVRRGGRRARRRDRPVRVPCRRSSTRTARWPRGRTRTRTAS